MFADAVCVYRPQFWPPRDLVIVRVYGTISASYESQFTVNFELHAASGGFWGPAATTFYSRPVRDFTTFGWPEPFSPGDGRLANYTIGSGYSVTVRAYLNGVLRDERTIGCPTGFEP